MHVILLEKVAKLGGLGDEVKVKDGFARNFLIPQGKARRATEANRKEFEALRAELEKAQAEKLATAHAQAAQLEGKVITLARKAGVDGRLFGSVTNLDIVDALARENIQVERASVRMPQGPLKMIGEYTVEIALNVDVHVALGVTVVAEQ